MKLKKYLYSASLLSLIFFLSGCVKMDKHGNPDPNGWIIGFSCTIRKLHPIYG